MCEKIIGVFNKMEFCNRFRKKIFVCIFETILWLIDIYFRNIYVLNMEKVNNIKVEKVK